MSTLTQNKKPVLADWPTTKIQAEALKFEATLYATLQKVVAKENSQLADEVIKIALINKEYYKNLPIKQPYDLVTAIAEYVSNVFGVKVSVVEDTNKPALVFEGGSLAEKLAAVGNVPPSQVPPIVEHFKNGLADLGTQFGFKTEIATVQPDFVVTYNK